MKTSTKVFLVIISLAVSFGLGYYATPTKIEIKTVVKTETLKVEGKSKVVYRDKITHPDGTIIEKEVEHEETNTREESKSLATSETLKVKDVGLVLSILTIVPINRIIENREYALIISKRIIGNLNLSVIGSTDKRIGLGIGWSF